MLKTALLGMTFAASVLASTAAHASTVLTGAFDEHLAFGSQVVANSNGLYPVPWLGEHGHVLLGAGTYDISFVASADIFGLALVKGVNERITFITHGLSGDNYSVESGAFSFGYVSGGASEDYRAGVILRGRLTIPRAWGASFGTPPFTSSSYAEYSGFVAVTGLGAAPGTWTMTVSGVPTPASWVMMLIGFSMLGGVIRLRRLRSA